MSDKRPIPVNIVDEMREAMLAYAMSVIIGRALPDVRDGLKPVQRRVLYSMHELKNNWNGPYKKSARVVGDCIGKYHPHGDAAVYDTLARMAQDFSLRYLLVDGQGNFGSVDGDPPAAMRYTEVRMARLAHQLLADLEKETVDFMPNYDESSVEPSVLPTKIPNLLVNGSQGIAVGMATNIPPHNLGEVINACVALIDDPTLSLAQLMHYVPGPDFPTGGMILGSEGIRKAYETGRGALTLRAVTNIEDMGNGRERIVVTELPYQVNKAALLEKIASLVHDKVIEGISELRDESDRHGMRMVIELRRDAQSAVILNQLFKLTPLQTSFGINNVAIVHGEPRLLSLKEMLLAFVDHRKDVTLRRCKFELRKFREREHILDGFRIALDFIDQVITIIRQSQNIEIARNALMSSFGLSDIQAQAILDMRLSRLTGMEREKVLAELADVRAEIERLEAILASEALLLNLIKSELFEVKDSFGDARRSQLAGALEGELEDEDLIPVEDVVVTVTHEGYIKRVSINEYRVQGRGGRGKAGMTTKEEDYVEHLFVASSHDHMLFFTNTGRVYVKRVFTLPQGTRQSKGKPIVNVLELDEGEKLAMVLPVSSFGNSTDADDSKDLVETEFVEEGEGGETVENNTKDKGPFLVFATARGVVKKTALSQFAKVRAKGIIAILLREDDRLISVRQTSGNDQIVLASKNGKAIRFNESEVRAQGRSSSGVKGMSLELDDEVVSCVTIAPEELETAKLFACSANGYGKYSAVDLYRLSHRGGKGVANIAVNDRNGQVVSVFRVDNESDQYLIVTDGGTIIRGCVSSVRETGRAAQGVRLIKLSDNEQVVSVARYVENDAGEESAENGENASVPMREVIATLNSDDEPLPYQNDPNAASKVQAWADSELAHNDQEHSDPFDGDNDTDDSSNEE